MDFPHLHLVSFDICPFVQRSLITLNYKAAPYELTRIDLADPPDWFRERSPLGKVPILIVNGDTVLFESAVINEYIDAVTPPERLPPEPLERARARAWIEYLSEQTFAQYRWMTAADEDAFERAAHEAARGLERLERQMADDHALAGAEFSLVDATLAPLLMRYALLTHEDSPWDPESFPRLAARWQWLEALDAVRDSVPADFSQRLATYLDGQTGTAPRQLAAALRRG
ncbi:glutathione S-transferase family protein [Thioalkalivibrio halophilus]|uniref:Glutathione S-transferase n=1 Tax=Thioalkalivibrio halophilus TaxID=252474 RepID=A0A1V2ZZY6_9GAMM|nr:glutathione S-transferase family protein [Thioalkalivibrio halophilus]OOC10403.1 glutathione S-transferase [Thioalkalivibrio halophilus]